MDLFPYLDVLVLDSDVMFCLLAEETLKILGFSRVYTACGSAAGARILDHHRPALVLVDVDRHRADFWNALAEGDHRGSLVVATSFDEESRTHSAATRADAFLVKPYSKHQLLRTITGLLTGDAGQRCKIVPFRRMDRRKPAGFTPAFDRGDRGDFSR